MENSDHKSVGHKHDDRPKNPPSENLDLRIKGLEDAKKDPSMTPADIAALNRAIAKLQQKKAEKEQKSQDSSETL